jgi:hypothetical protein
MSFTPGGKNPKQQDMSSIIRGLESRIQALELDRPKIYTQDTLTNSWTIQHGKGRFVTARLFDSSGNEIDISSTCPNENEVLLYNKTPFSGTAIVF